jgi:glycosyltransferase involved in cell wall biosynthesis
MGSADGVTVIMEPLKQFVPTNTPSLTLWPGVNSEDFYPREKNPELFQKFDIPPDSLVFCYTGNVHAVNIAEVRSLYLAIALLNREGKPAILIRTGRDFCQFLGEDDQWARQYCRELGYVDRSLLPDIVALADVLIQPGRVDKFNNYRFPSKLPEFFAMGKPVILPNTNIALEMEHQKHAWILPVVNALNIIQAVELITQDPELYHQLSQGAVHFAQTRLNWRKNSELLKLFYQEITQGEANILKPLVTKN